jgi:aryl-alcohol dehydrogenase-like predicted oxidoreductase
MTPVGAMFGNTVLGATGLHVGRLGVAASYGVSAAALEAAFAQGVNYFYWGTFRRSGFGQAIRNLASHRDRMVIVIQSFSRIAGLMGWSLERALGDLRLDHADVLLLGLWNRPVPERILDAARKLKERGLVRYLAASSHDRLLIRWVDARIFDVVHFRYNAIHTGAEMDIFPYLSTENRPGTVAYTATSWKQLLDPKRVPKNEKVPRASDCYRFVLARPEVDVCMTGPSNAEQMTEALEALRRGPLQEDELTWMRRVGAAIYAR